MNLQVIVKGSKWVLCCSMWHMSLQLLLLILLAIFYLKKLKRFLKILLKPPPPLPRVTPQHPLPLRSKSHPSGADNIMICTHKIQNFHFLGVLKGCIMILYYVCTFVFCLFCSPFCVWGLAVLIQTEKGVFLFISIILFGVFFWPYFFLPFFSFCPF